MASTFHQKTRAKAKDLAAVARRLNENCGFAMPDCLDKMALVYFTDGNRTPEAFTVLDALPKGSGVIYRNYDHEDRMEEAIKFAVKCQGLSLNLFVAQDIKLARHVNALGVHLPSHMLHLTERKPEALIVSAAVHNTDDIAKANALKLDLVFLSPVFPTHSHPGSEGLGISKFKALAAQSDIPVYGLGGVTLENATRLQSGTVAGFGAIGAFEP